MQNYKKTILFISPYLPSENSGHAGAQLIYRNLLEISKIHKVLLLTFINKDEINEVANLEKIGINVYSVKLNRNSKSITLFFGNLISHIPAIFKSFFLFQPFFVTKYYNKKMLQILNNIFAENNIDLIQIEYNIMHHYLNYKSVFKNNIKSVLMLHDVSTKVSMRSYQLEINPFVKFKKYIEYLKWNKIEPKIIQKFDDVIVLTEEDRNYISKWRSKQVHTIPPQLNLSNLKITEKKEIQIVFIGSFNREPNINALEILINDIFPKLKFEYPDLKLKIMGKFLSNSIQKRVDGIEGIEYLGFIKNINEEISKSILMIAPIFIGAGLKMKIPHTMCCGVPVITTTVGAEGIDIKSKNGLIVSDNIDSIIELSIKYLKDYNNLIELGLNAKKSVINLFGSENIIKKLNKIYLSA